MGQFDIRFFIQFTFSCCNVVVLSLAFAIGMITQEIYLEHLGYETKVDGAQKIGLDWEVQPFVDFKVAKVEGDKGECPAEFPEEMVYDVWNGL